MNLKHKFLSLILVITMAISLPLPCYSIGISSLQHLKQKTESVKKSEAKHVLGKFLKSMMLVAGSAAAIFLLLLAYKRFKSTKIVTIEECDIEKNLNSLETVDEATKFVIEKF